MALLEVSNLTKNFGGLTALSDVSFHVDAGELLSVIGPNGSGKSTLFNLISGIHKPTFGSVRFDGKDITYLRPHNAAHYGIGRTFQRITVFRQDTVLDNVIVGQRLHTRTGVWGAIVNTSAARREERQTRERAREILSFVGLSDKENEVADNMKQEAQKRLSIGLALATAPKLLLLDEPAGGVNLREIGGLAELIAKIRESGITVCLIEHKMKMVMNISDRVIVLNHGRKIAEGSPNEVVANEEVVKAYLGARYVA